MAYTPAGRTFDHIGTHRYRCNYPPQLILNQLNYDNPPAIQVCSALICSVSHILIVCVCVHKPMCVCPSVPMLRHLHAYSYVCVL